MLGSGDRESKCLATEQPVIPDPRIRISVSEEREGDWIVESE
jgi:hypothetical protein